MVDRLSKIGINLAVGRSVGLIDVDGHNYPNLALMKISAWHKANGDNVEWWNGLKHYDIVYQSKVFDEMYSQDNEFVVMADEVIKGGTGYGLDNKLDEEIEHIMPDYSLYGIADTAYGFLTRGCPRSCPFCIVSAKEGRKSHHVANIEEFHRGQKNIDILDPNILACKEHEDLLMQLVDCGAWVNFSQGLDARLLTKESIELIDRIKVKNIHFAWDFMKDERAVIDGLNLWLRHSNTKSSGRNGGVYVLTNFNTTQEEDLYRVEILKEMNFDPYVMIYNKPTAPKITRHLQRYANNKFIFWATTWEEYLKARR